MTPRPRWGHVVWLVRKTVIMFTIKRYGVLVFTIVMAVRQMMSIVVSTYLFGHRIKPVACVGIAVVFAGIAFRIIMRRRLKTPRPPS